MKRKVLQLNIGYISGESKEDIYSTNTSIAFDALVEKGLSTHKPWQTFFSLTRKTF